ncbi:phage holin family protein [Anaerosinus massiliensis]|uniref:phage holin family protein n=1 Tax=Massilibacillus massiliensis TaxID=1806837 RepID=UPI000DA5F6C5|nr:phage holin family protein [Massilibacillus massiliensis]
MNFNELWISICKAFNTLLDAWVIKAMIAFIVPILTGIHGSALTAFITLVFIDLITRWIAICYEHLSKNGQSTDLFSCIKDIPTAIREGYINSSAMKHRFVGKILVYVILTIVAVKADELIVISSESPVLLKATWVYLAITEAISILENLRDAGIEQANDLLNFLRDKASLTLNKFKNR